MAACWFGEDLWFRGAIWRILVIIIHGCAVQCVHTRVLALFSFILRICPPMHACNAMHVHVHIYYIIKLQCPFVCLCVCLYPPFFRHDRLTATKFGTHMRIDPGIIRAQTNLTHPTTGGILRGQNFKSSGNFMNCQENRYIFFNQPPPPGGEI